MEIPDALKLIGKLDLTEKIITGYAIFRQREITSGIVGNGGDYLLPVKGNQRVLKEEIITAFNEPIFPLNEWHAPPEADHGRIEQRQIAILSAEALGEHIGEPWPTVRSIVRIVRKREHFGDGRMTKTETETVWLVTSRTVVWVFVEQFWFEFVAVFHCLQGCLAAQG